MRRPTTHGQSLPRDFARPPYLDPDTAHVVFRPARMSTEELAAGYAWCYERLFSHGSIWRRRPDEAER